jgi:hypothetical protein
MTDAKNLLESVREADRTLSAVHIPAGASHRIRTAIRDRGHVRRDESSPIRMLVVGFFLMMATLASAWLLFSGPKATRHEAASASYDCTTKALGDAVHLTGSCMLTLSTMQIETSGATTLSETADGVRMLKGTAVFQVRPVPAGRAPVRVRVSGGVIEIVGTKFLVEQREGGGSIQLIEGTIRFVFASGRVSVLHAGERLNWVDDPASAAPPPSPSGSLARGPADDVHAPPQPQPSTVAEAPITGVDPGDPFYDEHPPLREALARFEGIQREAPYTEAERLREKLEPASFELGGALENSHADPARICAHWRWHTKNFPAGIYNGDINARMRKLGCQR